MSASMGMEGRWRKSMRATRKLVAVLACLIMVSVPMMVASDAIISDDSEGATYVTIIYDKTVKQIVPKIGGETFTVMTPDARPGYTFQYWDFNGKHVNPGEHSYFEYSGYPGDIWFFNSVWTGNQYTAKFMDGSKLVESRTCTFGSAIGKLPTVEKEGHQFVGWSPTGKSTDIISSDTLYSTVGEQTFTAVWAANVYNVSLYDGDKLCSVMECTYGQPYGKLPTLSKDGYIFKGWAKDKSGVDLITYDTKYTTIGNSSIYAVWVPQQFLITFMDNGVQIDTKRIDFNSAIGDMPKPIRKGHTFIGWSTDGTEGTLVSSETKFTFLSDITLYSVWKANTYKITFMNGDTVFSSKDVVFGKEIGDMPSLTKTGHSLLGWSLDGTKDKMLDPQDKYDFDTDIKLYPVWSANHYTLTLLDGETKVDAMDVTYGNEIGPMPAPTKVGKTFEGWSTDGTEKHIISSKDMYVWDKDMTLQAVWSTNGYRISFVSDGVEIGCKHVNFGEKIGDMPTATSIGKTFIGWSYDSTEAGMVNPDTVFSYAGDVTFYAMFSVNKYTVTFDSTGGKTTPSPIQLSYGDKFPNLPTVEKEGKRFIGWSLTEDGSSMVTSESILNVDHDVTLYAIWGDEILAPTESIFDNPISVVIMASAILATIGISYWVYRKGLI